MSSGGGPRITAQGELGSQSRGGGTRGRQQGRLWEGKGAGPQRGLSTGQGVRGGTRERGRARGLLVTAAGSAGVRVEPAPWRWQAASGGQRPARRDTNGGSSQGLGARASREAPREGQGAGGAAPALSGCCIRLISCSLTSERLPRGKSWRHSCF